MLTKIKEFFRPKHVETECFWAGRGENPLKEMGVKDLSEHKKKKEY